MNAFSAAFEAEYADRVAAGTIAKFEPVLRIVSRYLKVSKLASSSLYQASLSHSAHQKRQEFDREIHKRRKVRRHFRVESCQVDLLGLGEIDGTLDPGIQEYTIQFRVIFSDVRNKLVHVASITEVEPNCTGLLSAMSLHERIKSILSAANSNDLDPLEHQTVCHGSTNSRSGAHHENLLIWKGHVTNQVEVCSGAGASIWCNQCLTLTRGPG